MNHKKGHKKTPQRNLCGAGLKKIIYISYIILLSLLLRRL